jgi:hypothetical protein
MSHRTRALALVVMISLAVGCATPARDTRVSQAPPPAVPAPGALIGPPTGWRTLTEGQPPVPIPGHPPVTASGVVASYDTGTSILRFEDGRMVKLTNRTVALQPRTNVIRIGDLVVLQDVLPVGVQSGTKTLALGRRQRMGRVATVDESRGLVRLTDGTAVHVARTTNVHVGADGSSVTLAQLQPGDEVVIVVDEGNVARIEPSATADAFPSALPRQDLTDPSIDAGEVMIFRIVPR